MKSKFKLVDLILCALFTALIAVGAFIRIPIPVVPFTMQVLFTTMAALLLGAKLGALSSLLYMVLGLIGLPIFTQGGGIWYVLKPTFGYIIGFVIGAYVTGLIAHKVPNPSYKRLVAASFAGLAIIYAIGMVYLYAISHLYTHSNIGIGALFVTGFLTSISGDVATCLLGCLLAKRLIPYMNKKRALG